MPPPPPPKHPAVPGPIVPHAPPAAPKDRDRLVAAAQHRLLRGDAEFARYADSAAPHPWRPGLYDYVFAVGDEPHQPDDVFGSLRWGGQLVYLSRDRWDRIGRAH